MYERRLGASAPAGPVVQRQGTKDQYLKSPVRSTLYPADRAGCNNFKEDSPMIDHIRRNILATGAAATAVAAAPQVFAQQAGQGTTKFYEKGPVRIAY
jgi:hypothetical protein